MANLVSEFLHTADCCSRYTSALRCCVFLFQFSWSALCYPENVHSAIFTYIVGYFMNIYKYMWEKRDTLGNRNLDDLLSPTPLGSLKSSADSQVFPPL